MPETPRRDDPEGVDSMSEVERRQREDTLAREWLGADAKTTKNPEEVPKTK